MCSQNRCGGEHKTRDIPPPIGQWYSDTDLWSLGEFRSRIFLGLLKTNALSLTLSKVRKVGLCKAERSLAPSPHSVKILILFSVEYWIWMTSSTYLTQGDEMLSLDKESSEAVPVASLGRPHTPPGCFSTCLFCIPKPHQKWLLLWCDRLLTHSWLHCPAREGLGQNMEVTHRRTR